VVERPGEAGGGERLTLLDLMAVVAAFGVGMGVAAFVDLPAERLIHGSVYGAVLVLPLCLVSRARRGLWRPPTRCEWAGLSPLASLMVWRLVRAAPENHAALYGLAAGGAAFHLYWGVIGVASLARWCRARDARRTMTWTSLYGCTLAALALAFVLYAMVAIAVLFVMLARK
jgi:hypothetical protein